MAYGLTSSGKTYTMFNTDSNNFGIVPRSIQFIIQNLEQQVEAGKIEYYQLGFSFLQIYNEVLSDLLQPSTQLKIRLADDMIEIDNASIFQVTNVDEVTYLLY